MQITEITTDGLKREYKVVVAANDIESKISARLVEIGQTMKLPGFRPGKVPMKVLRQRFGSSVLGEVLERAVGETSTQAMRERGLRPALQPKIEIVSFNEGTDLEYKMAVEVLPEIAPIDYAAVKIERLVPTIPDEEIDAALKRVADGNRKATPVDRAAASGDIVVIDFVGKIDGVAFPGGTGSDHKLTLGSSSFIAGFEDQLIGAVKGEKRAVNVTFPAEYGSEELAGKDAVFDVEVKGVEERLPAAIDDDLATSVGMESLEELRKVVREQLERDYGNFARQKLKRALLDQLADQHHFEVPGGMVDAEFNAIWEQFEKDRKERGTADQEDAGKTDDELKAEYRTIADRRVRLGLLLSEIGRANNIQVSQEDMNRALGEEARRHPGYEKQVVEYYRRDENAMASLRAPIFEDKVIDFIVEMASVTDRNVSPAELLGTDAAPAATA